MVNSNEFSIILLQNSVIVQRTFFHFVNFPIQTIMKTSRKVNETSYKTELGSSILHIAMWFSRRFEPLHELGHSLLRRHPCYLIDLGSFSVHTGTIEKEKTKWLFSPLNFLHPLCYSFLRDDVFFCLLEGRIRGFLFS